MKKIISLLLAVVMVCGLCAVAAAADDVTEVTLKVWAPQEDQANADSWLQQMEAKFEAAHPEYKMTWVNEVAGEDVAKDSVIKDPAAAADVYMYANDQLGDLLSAQALAKLGGPFLEQVKNDNSQAMVDSVTSTDGGVYGFPVAANTWFCYYNKDVYTEEDVKSLNTMLEKGVVAFPTVNSWYLGSFFFADGATVFGENGNDAAAGVSFGEDNGMAALNAILDMVANPNYRTDDNGLGNSGLKSGEVSAYFSGSWDYDGLKEALGDKVSSVKVSAGLGDSPAVLTSEGQVSLEMERIMAMMPESAMAPKAQRVLELNAQHPVFDKLCAAQQAGEGEKVALYAKLLLDQALLVSGMPVDDPVAFAENVCALM